MDNGDRFVGSCSVWMFVHYKDLSSSSLCFPCLCSYMYICVSVSVRERTGQSE